MSQVTATEARATLPDILDRVGQGDEVTITRHGRAVAVVVRPDALRTRRADAAFRRADEIGALLAEARHAPLRAGPGLSVDRAERLVAQIDADRGE
jgi:prevent-host-death family protein